MKMIPIARPLIGDEEIRRAAEILRSGWLVQGPQVAEFERCFARRIGTPHARAVNSCTAALHLALLAVDIGEGDRVIIPSFTYVATANAVTCTGAEVIPADIDPATFNIDAAQVERLLRADTGRTIRAVIPVHLFGLCADMEPLLDLAAHHHLSVIEDAACAFGALYAGRHAGTMGDAGCFSFHPRKHITTGEGGMVATPHHTVAENVAVLRNHGAAGTEYHRHSDPTGALLPDFARCGYNYRLTDIQAAVGLAQLERAEHILDAKRALAAEYDALLRDIPVLAPPVEPPGYTHGYQSYVCLYTGGRDPAKLTPQDIDTLHEKRNRLMHDLAELGIATRQGTHAVHLLSYYRRLLGIRPEDLPRSWMADRLSIALPLLADMNTEELDRVTAALRECAR